MNKDSLHFYKYKKYKEKYLNLLKQTNLNQHGGDLNELRQCLKEASKIFKIVNEYGEKDGIEFFITGSVAFLFYFVDFYNKNSDSFTEHELKYFNDITKFILPNDLDIFWTEFLGINYELFYTEVSDFIGKKMKRKIDVTVGEEISKPILTEPIISPEKTSILPSSFAPPPLLSLSLDSLRNKKNMTCIGNDDLFVIGSHYSKVPIPNDPTFYKCIDKTSKYNKIDFYKLKTNVKCTNIFYEDSIVRILGINDLIYLYKNSDREKDDIKISILEYICKKLDGINEYVGMPLFMEEDHRDMH